MASSQSEINGSARILWPWTTPTTTTESPFVEIDAADATWILICGMIIFTMQTGFGLLEAGVVNPKNEVNIMMKNVVDIVLGGLSYWLFGFGMTFGHDRPSNPFIGFGEYVVDGGLSRMGPLFVSFFFQLSFATTATTIASGSMAERCDFRAYCVFSLLNPIVYSIPARWLWGPTGFLAELGAFDIAGSGAVHLLGGVTAFVAAWFLGPRLGRYDNGRSPPAPGNAVNCILGLFSLWWGWIAFNAGSTFGVSGDKWKFAARAAVTTMVSSIGGGLAGVVFSFIKGTFDVLDMVNSVLGALVGVTAGCAVYHALDSFIVGILGAVFVLLLSSVTDRMGVDDPVGATVVHGFGGIWGMLAVGLFAEDDQALLGITKGQSGLFRGGGWNLLLVQFISCVCIIVWAFFVTFFILWIIDKILPFRMKAHEEILGADFVEHGIPPKQNPIYPGFLKQNRCNHKMMIRIAKEAYEAKIDDRDGLLKIILKNCVENEVRESKRSSKLSSILKSAWKKNWKRKESSISINRILDLKNISQSQTSWDTKFDSNFAKEKVGTIENEKNYCYPIDYSKKYIEHKRTFIWMD